MATPIGHAHGGDVHSITKRLLRELSERDGWFAPVSDILDFYVDQVGCSEIGKSRFLLLELLLFWRQSNTAAAAQKLYSYGMRKRRLQCVHTLRPAA